MRLLLDTHVFYWACQAPERITQSVRDALEDPENQVLVSAVSGYEIGFKRAIGKLQWAGSVVDACDLHGFDTLPIALTHAEAAANLPMHHRDPFDRLLIAQATQDQLRFVTGDRAASAYAVDVLEA
ncbi:type II toxin-antitoxin system VapC family toxin [bacterium]|nr:type II toxin-antitoxin system VapC family toxin [bacterium]